MQDDIIVGLIEISDGIIKNANEKFSGLALALVNNKFDDSCIVSLRPDFIAPNYNLFADKDLLINFFVKESELGNVVHDGFHFMNSDCNLILSGQYFVPKPNKTAELNAYCGIRYHSGLFGSLMEGVDYILTISSNRSVYIFENGEIVYKRLYKMNNQKREEEK
ncbi:MAG: hypothetical protein IJZ29_02620 [Clostridia bacterium]|nr:hypothetical protein [Clostridia bacterium]